MSATADARVFFVESVGCARDTANVEGLATDAATAAAEEARACAMTGAGRPMPLPDDEFARDLVRSEFARERERTAEVPANDATADVWAELPTASEPEAGEASGRVAVRMPVRGVVALVEASGGVHAKVSDRPPASPFTMDVPIDRSA